MAKKKTSRSKASTYASEGEEGAGNGGSDLLIGGWYYKGKTYDPKKKGDQQAARDIFETEGALAPSGVTDADERKTAHEEELQRLADAKVLKGYGTTAPEEPEPEEEGESGAGS